MSTAPLRKILGHARQVVNSTGATVVKEMLECGHYHRISEDAYGPTSPSRRRCQKCAQNAPVEWGKS